MNALIARYRTMPAREQKLLWVFMVVMVLAGYLFWAAMVWQDMFNAEKLANRKANRIETRIGDLDTPTLENGISEKVQEQLQSEITQQEAALRYLLSQRLPLDSAGPREQLKLEVAKLAKSQNLTVVRLNTSSSELREPLDGLQGEKLRRYFDARPSLHMSLEGEYLNVIAFMDGLSALPYHTHVGNFSAERKDGLSPYLRIELELKI